MVYNVSFALQSVIDKLLNIDNTLLSNIIFISTYNIQDIDYYINIIVIAM